MKLFGSRRNASRTDTHSGAGAAKGLSGLQRGLLLLAGSVVVLTGSVMALYHSVVRPIEIVQPVAATELTEEVFTPPMVIQVETHINEQGEKINVPVERPASHKEGFYNILVVGTDDDGGRTDTIMIARLNANDHTTALLSIPRDTVISGNYAVPKINGVYGSAGKGEQGMKALEAKVAQLLGFEVDGYALVNLDAFIELVDLIGGVDFEVPMNMNYDDPTQDLYIHLNAGMQHLDGQKSMQLVRFRKGYATQDIMRTQVQQQFVQALAEKCHEEVTLSKIGDLAEIFKENVNTDLTLGNLAYFGQELLKCDFENMYTYTLEGQAVMLNGASCYAIYLNKTLDVVNQYFNPYDAPITAANVNIRTPESIYASQAAAQPQVEEITATVTEAEETEPEEGTEAPEVTEAEPAEETPPQEETALPTDGWVEEAGDTAEEYTW